MVDDAHTWAQRRVWILRQAEAVESAPLILLASVGAAHPLWHVLHEFIAELRSLGMRPVVLREADGGGID